jgi:hypothetical protein
MSSKQEEDTFTIKKWEALCTWKLGGVHNRICGICRNGLDEPSQEYKVRDNASARTRIKSTHT